MVPWDEREQYFCDQAAVDLAESDEVLPSLVGWRGDETLLVALLRPFGPGGYAQPLIELLALALPLGADRLAVALSARAWSVDDPIPPVLDGVGDLRQRVLVITAVDGAGARPVRASAVYPFEVSAGRVAWGCALREPETGWIGEVFETALAQRATFATDRAVVRRQAVRCMTLGHEIALSPAVADLVTGSTTADRAP